MTTKKSSISNNIAGTIFRRYITLLNFIIFTLRKNDNYELALAITDAGTPVKKLAIGIKK